MLTLHLPKRNDPISKVLLLGLLAAALWANVRNIEHPAQALASGDPFAVIDASPTPALPTAPPVELPALAVPTPAPELVGGELIGDPAIVPDEVPPGDPPIDPIDNSDYLANVGAQAPHSPRGDSSDPPPSQTGPVLIPASGDEPASILVPAGSPDPNAPPAAPEVPAMAVAVPHTTEVQAAVAAERESRGCAPGQVFYPRSGCHTPGSGGDMPGAVGAP